jgi:hypothetical protein
MCDVWTGELWSDSESSSSDSALLSDDVVVGFRSAANRPTRGFVNASTVRVGCSTAIAISESIAGLNISRSKVLCLVARPGVCVLHYVGAVSEKGHSRRVLGGRAVVRAGILAGEELAKMYEQKDKAVTRESTIKRQSNYCEMVVFTIVAGSCI